MPEHGWFPKTTRAPFAIASSIWATTWAFCFAWIIGPITAASSSHGPTVNLAACSTSLARNWACRRRST